LKVLNNKKFFHRSGFGAEFREHPKDTEVTFDEGNTSDVTLACRPPKGDPEPKVQWIKDNMPLITDSGGDGRISMQKTGSLRIRNVLKSDAGVYVCLASNIAGKLESNPAKLVVNGLGIYTGYI